MSDPDRDLSVPWTEPFGRTDDLSWGRVLWARLCAMVLLKALGTTAFMVLFFMAYLHLLHHPLFPVTLIPVTWVDRWIGFHPWALVPYVSLWVYVSLPPALMPNRGLLVRYGVAAALMCGTGLLIFLFWPTALPPMHLDWGGMPGFGELKHIDGSGNACPSLHVASAIFSALWLHRLLRDIGSPRGVLGLNLLWCLVIVYSTMAIKQHLLPDVLAGALLGSFSAYWSLRWLVPRKAAANRWNNEKKTVSGMQTDELGSGE